MNAEAARRGDVRTIDVLGALSLAADMALGLRSGHGVRATYIGMHIADELGVPPEQRVDLFYAELLMDAGCTAWTSQMAATILGNDIVARRELFFANDPSEPRELLRWLAGYMATGERLDTRLRRSIDFALHGKQFMLEGLRNTADTASRMARRLGTSVGVQEGLRYVFEQWDGHGPYERRTAEIPLVSRIVFATIFLEVFHQLGGREAAVTLARGRRGKTLDPHVVDAFLRVASLPDFWTGLEDDAVWARVHQLEPESVHRYLGPERIEDAARAFADFADLKSFYSAGHSRRVASLAERIAIHLALSPDAVATIHLAGLVHDLGLAAVPSFVLHKPAASWAAVDWESMRLHPYHAERILASVPAFAPVTPLVAAHHERPDGQGYPLGLRGEQLPLGARVLAVADVFDELTHARPEGAPLQPGAALEAMRQEAGARFDASMLQALAQILDLPLSLPAASSSKRPWPNGLTDREVEVLRALATGASRRNIATQLSVSEHTVRHHLENIYGKIDVGTRVEATLFALEHDLLA